MLPPIARRFVAGETRAGAFERARQLDERGIGTILNRLGEHYGERAPADRDTTAYCEVLGELAQTDLPASISVKPSQLGLDIGEDVFRENLSRIVDRAAETGGFVWLDMEDHTTTDPTLSAFERHAREAGCVGVCLQANLRRTPGDLDRLAELPGKIRLVKGAYDEPPGVAYQDRERVDEAYRELLGQAFRTFEGGIAVGSHDLEMIDRARELHAEHGTPFEIQMLMGVREDAQEELAREHPVRQYVPYGPAWLSYFYRRVTERKENLAFALRAIVR